MQKCPKCGKEIKYIAKTNQTNIKCDAEEITVYTITGRKIEGYRIHNCEGENNDSRKSDLDNK